MTEDSPIDHEKEACLGLSTLEISQSIIGNNPAIQAVRLKPYLYVPNKASTKQDEAYDIPREDFLKLTRERLDEWCIELGEGYNIALDSAILFQGGETGHLVMTDLHPPKSPENLTKIKERFSQIVKPQFGGGFFLETNRSYHFVGEETVRQDDWHELQGRLLITSIVTVMPEGTPNVHEVIADYRYIGHSLIRGSTPLRLTSNGKKVSPFVVGYI